MNIFDEMSLENKVGLLILACLALFGLFVRVIAPGSEPTRYNNARMCVQFCEQNDMKVREWTFDNCTCTNVNSSVCP